MRTLALVAALAAASPAHACHHFSHWAYPWPQPKCNAQTRVDRSWYVEIVLPDADSARTQGLEKLKTLLGPQGIGSLANKP